MFAKFFSYYFAATFVAASSCYLLLHWFDAIGRVFIFFTAKHPFQYLVLESLLYSLAATAVTPVLARLSSGKRAPCILLLMIASVLLSSVPGGMLWSIHDMLASGHFPPAEYFWSQLYRGAMMGARLSVLVVWGLFPLNAIGLVAGWCITEWGVRYFRVHWNRVVTSS